MREETRNQKVSLNPGAGYWMDIFSHLFVVRIVLFFEKTKISRKEAGVGPFKKTVLRITRYLI